MELSPNNTLIRRPAFTKYCTTAFGSSDYPLNYYSFQNLSGTIYTLVDTPTTVYTFDTSNLTNILTKGTTNQTYFQKVGSTLYFCNGTDVKKWNGSTTTNWGIATPATAATLSFSAGSLSPRSGYTYVYVFKNNSTQHISTSSPVSASTGVQTSKNIGLSGSRSTDPQVDKIDIYRTTDGGSVFYYLATINNPGAGTWSYTDSTADSGLNTFLIAPLNHQNDPPPAGANNVCFHMGLMWVSVDNLVYFSGGGLVTNGVPEEAFPPANVFKFPGKVTAMVSTSQGLIVFTSENAYLILGTDITNFYSKAWQKNFGVKTQNCVAQDGDLFYVYTSKKQLFEFSSELDEAGFPIGDKLKANFTPSSTYLALHRNGTDSGLFISNGSTDMYRYNVNTKSWSTLLQPTSGVKCIGSIEVSDGNWQLMIGKASGSGFIMSRDLTSYTDLGGTYSAFATVGSIVVAVPGTVAGLESVLIERAAVGSAPTVSVLLNEISGSFTALPNPVADPALLPASSTIIAVRHDLKAAASPLPQFIRHLQVKIDFGSSSTAADELLGLGLKQIEKVS